MKIVRQGDYKEGSKHWNWYLISGIINYLGMDIFKTSSMEFL